MPQAQQHQTRRADLPLAGRTMELRGFTRAAEPAAGGEPGPLATAKLIFSAGASVRRYDYLRDRYYLEQLVVEEGAIRLDRLKRGAPLLNTHQSYDLEAVLGVVENPVIANGVGECDATFSRRESVAGYVQDVADRVIRGVSCGYIRHRIEMVPPVEDGGPWVYRVIDWEPMEVSLTPIQADIDSQVRAAGAEQPADTETPQLRTWPCEFIETRAAAISPSPTVGATAETTSTPQELRTMPNPNAAGGTAPASTTTTTPAGASTTTPPAGTEPAQRSAEEIARDHTAAAVQAEQQRATNITELCTRHNVAHLAAGMIQAGQSVDQARAAVLAALEVRDAAAGGHRNVRVETVRDEHATRMAGIEEAIVHRVMPSSQLTDNGRQFRGMTMLEIGREMLEAAGVRTRGMPRLELATRMLQLRSGGMMTTSDFSHIMGNVANRRLRGAYEQNPGTYGRWARRAPNAPDFKSMNVVQLSGAPTLLRTNEHGEFKYGAFTDGGETYALLTYGRIVSLSRQAIINDDLRTFDRLTGAFGNSARRLENATVYSQLTDNAALADGVALFHADHGNLSTGAGSALAFDGLKAARTAMRTQTGLAGEVLNLAPRFLIAPAALEQTAYQLTSNNYVPAVKAEVNEFREGGRTALEPVIEPILDAVSATAWYVAADNAQIDTVEYCYLDGAEGPVIESENGFDVDGVSYKCRLDFAAKAVDHRGMHKANGA